MICLEPPEPKWIRNKILDLMTRFRGDSWNWRTAAVWYRNSLASYLWTEAGLKDKLKVRGWTWQGFLKALSHHTEDVVAWAQGAITWQQLLEKLYNELGLG